MSPVTIATRVAYLEDEKHGRGGVKATVAEGDDGGAPSGEQVTHLPSHTHTHTPLAILIVITGVPVTETRWLIMKLSTQRLVEAHL